MGKGLKSERNNNLDYREVRYYIMNHMTIFSILVSTCVLICMNVCVRVCEYVRARVCVSTRIIHHIFINGYMRVGLIILLD